MLLFPEAGKLNAFLASKVVNGHFQHADPGKAFGNLSRGVKAGGIFPPQHIQGLYDGLLILTDGYAPPPSIPEGFKTKIVWVCEERSAYEAHHSWMEKLGRVCTIELR